MPKKKPTKGRQISLWCSDAEAAKFNRAAKKAGKVAGAKISRSMWLLRMANEAAK